MKTTVGLWIDHRKAVIADFAKPRFPAVRFPSDSCL